MSGVAETRSTVDPWAKPTTMSDAASFHDEQRIRCLKDEMTAALRRKSTVDVMALFAEQSVMFVLAPPLMFRSGVNAPGAAGVQAWFDSFEGELGYEVRDLEVACASAVAFCHSLDRISGQRTDGTKTDLWVRETLGLRKIRGAWRIAHQHQSVPMYMDGSNKAAIDLQP